MCNRLQACAELNHQKRIVPVTLRYRINEIVGEDGAALQTPEGEDYDEENLVRCLAAAAAGDIGRCSRWNHNFRSEVLAEFDAAGPAGRIARLRKCAGEHRRARSRDCEVLRLSGRPENGLIGLPVKLPKEQYGGRSIARRCILVMIPAAASHSNRHISNPGLVDQSSP